MKFADRKMENSTPTRVYASLVRVRGLKKEFLVFEHDNHFILPYRRLELGQNPTKVFEQTVRELGPLPPTQLGGFCPSLRMIGHVESHASFHSEHLYLLITAQVPDDWSPSTDGYLWLPVSEREPDQRCSPIITRYFNQDLTNYSNRGHWSRRL